MTIVEQRKHSRHPLLHQPVGEFRLLTPTTTYLIKRINDISNSGKRFYLDTSLPPRSRVTVEYIEPSLKLEVNGMVAWCATRLHGGDDGDGLGRFIVGLLAVPVGPCPLTPLPLPPPRPRKPHPRPLPLSLHDLRRLDDVAFGLKL